MGHNPISAKQAFNHEFGKIASQSSGGGSVVRESLKRPQQYDFTEALGGYLPRPPHEVSPAESLSGPVVPYNPRTSPAYSTHMGHNPISAKQAAWLITNWPFINL
jgi:hypothetical protein